MFRRLAALGAASMLLVLNAYPLAAQPAAEPSETPETEAAPAQAEAEVEARREPGLWEYLTRAANPSDSADETLYVIDTRLQGEGIERDRLPTNVSIITGERLVESRVRDVVEYLERELGVMTFDITGNHRQKTLDLRGFESGQNTVVLVDGVVQNASDSNSVTWSQIPVENIERIEILRGPASVVAGRGAAGGAINIITRRGGGRPVVGGAVDIGEHGYMKFMAWAQGAWNRVHYAGHAIREFGDGERDQSAFRRTGTWEKIGVDFDRWWVDVSHTSEISLFQQPSSLPKAQFELDRNSSRKDRPDYNRGSLHQVQAQAQWTPTDAWTVDANGFMRDQDSQTLVHFGGGGLDSRVAEESRGGAFQLGHRADGDWFEHAFTAGGDFSRWDFETITRNTDAAGNWLASIFNPAPGFVSDERELRQDVFGFFAGENLRLWKRLTLSAGARADESRHEFSNPFLPAQDGRKTFYETSWRAGAVVHVLDNLDVFGNYTEGFRVPSIAELYAFGGFSFSDNPDLKPEDTRNREIGMRWHWKDLVRVEGSYFAAETKDAIQFVATGLFSGQNRNVGEVSRRGWEASITAKLTSFADAWLNYTHVRAEFREGPFPRGNAVPLIPENDVAFGATVRPCSWCQVSADYQWTSDRIMDADQAHVAPKWDSFGVLNARVSASWKRMTAYVAVTNVLDESYESWAIWSEFWVPPQPFYVPGRGRDVQAGFAWDFEF